MLKRSVKVFSISFVAAFIFFFAASADAAIKLADEPGADPAIMQELQKDIDAFNGILANEMKVTLDKPVTVYFCPTREVYEQRLVSLLNFDKDFAARNAQATGGMSNGSLNTILLNGEAGIGKTSPGRAGLISHELFHQVQSQLMAGNKKAKPLKWMQEGTADYTGSHVSELMGYQSQDKWKLERINILRKADKHASASTILEINLDGWTKLMEDKMHPYEMSDLMVFYLATQVKGNFYAAIKEYYERIGKGEDGTSEAFENAFGLSLTQYLSGFSAWYLQTALDTAQIEVINYQNKVLPEAVEKTILAGDFTRNIFAGKFGQDIQSSQRLVLTANQEDYIVAISKEFGYTLETAKQKAENTTIIFWGNTFVQKESNGKVFNFANVLTLRYLLDLAPETQLKSVAWLYYGSGLAVGAYVNEMALQNTVEKYRTWLLKEVGKVKARPSLTEITSAQGWTDSLKKYGANTVIRISGIAALYISEKYGMESFGTWCKTIKETGDAQKAFTQTFGISITEFSAEFESYLAANLPK